MIISMKCETGLKMCVENEKISAANICILNSHVKRIINVKDSSIEYRCSLT